MVILSSKDEMKLNLKEELKKNSINENRIIFLEKINFEDHLSRHSIADLFLDSFNYNAHTTAVDALWTGLPILTKRGNSFSSRICGSLLEYFGLNNLVTQSTTEYMNRAVELATNPKEYKKIKDKITSPQVLEKCFNTKKYTLNLEKAYKKIHSMRVMENKFENIFIEED